MIEPILTKTIDQSLSRIMANLNTNEESEIHDKLRASVELPELFPVNPWRDGWYSVIWLEAPFKYEE